MDDRLHGAFSFTICNIELKIHNIISLYGIFLSSVVLCKTLLQCMPSLMTLINYL